MGLKVFFEQSDGSAIDNTARFMAEENLLRIMCPFCKQISIQISTCRTNTETNWQKKSELKQKQEHEKLTVDVWFDIEKGLFGALGSQTCWRSFLQMNRELRFDKMNDINFGSYQSIKLT